MSHKEGPDYTSDGHGTPGSELMGVGRPDCEEHSRVEVLLKSCTLVPPNTYSNSCYTILPTRRLQQTYFQKKSSIFLISSSDIYKSAGKTKMLLKLKHSALKPSNLKVQLRSEAQRQTALNALWKCFLAQEPHPVIDPFAQKTFTSKSWDKLLSVLRSCNEAPS